MEITKEELKQKIENGEKLVVDFWAPWCGPCKTMKPIFEKVSEEYRGNNSEIQLYTLNVEENKEFAAELGIRAIPTVKTFSGGEQKYSSPGMLDEGRIKELASELLN
jgi:putative thioredoxin